MITVKTGDNSAEKFGGSLGINIVSKNLETGFIKLDESIWVKPRNGEDNDEDEAGKKEIFKRNQKSKFEFEETDVRMVIQCVQNFISSNSFLRCESILFFLPSFSFLIHF